MEVPREKQKESEASCLSSGRIQSAAGELPLEFFSAEVNTGLEVALPARGKAHARHFDFGPRI